MADERDDPWSAGVTAEKPEPTWPPRSGDVADADDETSRLHTGRWMSPSLGAYDPGARHQALDDDGADDAYFRQFGYGESFGDGRLAAGYDGAPAAPSPSHRPGPAEPDPGPPLADGEVELDRPAPPAAPGDRANGHLDASSGRSPDTGFDAPVAWDEPSSWDDPAWSDAADRANRTAAGLGADRDLTDRSPLEGTDAGPADDHPDDRGDGDGDEGDGDDTGGDSRRNLIEWGVVLVGAVLLALVLRALVLQAFWIPSPSMETTLLVRDRVLVNKVSYRLHDINRGDVVVFRRTDEEIALNPELPHDVIKRVIALGGETIEIRDNQVFIDGLLLQEPYLDEGVVTTDYGPETVPEGHVFVMGDNRELSLDSRFETGPVAEDRVVGRAFFLFWPLNRIGAL